MVGGRLPYFQKVFALIALRCVCGSAQRLALSRLALDIIGGIRSARRSPQPPGHLLVVTVAGPR